MNSSRRARELRFRTAIPSGRTFQSALFAAVVVAGTIGCRPPSEVVEGPDASNPGSGGHVSGSGGSGSGSGGSGSGGNGSGGSASGGSVGSGGSGSGGSVGSGGSGGSGSAGGSGSGGSVGGRSGTGGAGGASAGGRGGAGASSSGGTTGQASCTNAIMDGSETGVDCGGSCPACVAYKIGAPNADEGTKNACEGGGTGFICPRFMMFSPEMKQAAADDAKDNNWPQGSFNYAVVTLNGAKCCECFQIVYSNPQNSAVSATPPKAVIGQNFNQGGANNAFDLFMGKGGLGVQQAGCSKMYSTYPGIGEPNSGGIKATNLSECKMLSSQACVTAVTNQCNMIKASTPAVEKTTQNSCLESNLAESLYHENWNVKAQRIECPVHLTEVTGCRLNNQNLPKADPNIKTASQAGSWSSYGTTTMQDCCKPSCAWPGNVSNTMSPWSTMYQCSMNGNPMTK